MPFLLGCRRNLPNTAIVDGCNEFGVFWRVLLPLAGPALSTLAVFKLYGHVEFIFAATYLHAKRSIAPISAGFDVFSGAFYTELSIDNGWRNHHNVSIIILYLFFQRQFVQGLTAGALK